ncbi:MAG: acyltransferase [Planctomycetes bacterium]|nr:acyltransferase [Planctomycetota bacterium]
MTSRVVRAALTETCNVYAPMPGSVDELPSLAMRLDDVRRANVEHHVALIAEAARQGAQVVGLGELFAAPYFALRRDAFWRELAESAQDGPTVAALSACAREHRVVVVAPIYERDGERRFNTAVVIDADGAPLGRFRKCHIPQGRNEQGAFDERFYYEPSDGRCNPPGARAVVSSDPFLPVFETAVGRIGVSICYDRHFEGMVGGLAAGGAELVFSPAVTFGAKSHRLWEREFEVDACRHRVFVGGSNRRGSEPPWDQPYFGASHFVGPEGRCVDVSTHERLVIADLDLGSLAGPDPSGWDLRRDARPEIGRG